MKNKKGLLIVLSGASGTGKSTIMKEILKLDQNTRLSISATTRQKRPGEINGKHYHFVSKEEFQQMLSEDKFLEHANYCENYYGTPKQAVEDMRNQGLNVILEIEVDGAMQIKQKCRDAVMLFLMPPSFEELSRRLVDRETEPQEVVAERLKIALEEIKKAVQYDYIVVNEDILECAKIIDSIIKTAAYGSRQMEDFVIEVIKNAQTGNLTNS